MKLLTTLKAMLIFSMFSFFLASSVYAATIFSEDFSDNSAGWTLGTTWEIGPASSSSGGVYNGDPTLDHSPGDDNGVAGVVIGGNAPTNLHDFYYLTSPIINLSGTAGQTRIEYYRWLNSDYTPYMENVIDVFNGTDWMTIWNSGPSPAVQDSQWTLQSFEISTYTNNLFQLRFGYNIDSGGVFSVSSWNIDDVAIYHQREIAPVPEPSTIILLASGLVGLTWCRRKRKKA